MVPLAVLGSGYLAARLRAPATAEPLRSGDQVDPTLPGLSSATRPQAPFTVPAGNFLLLTFGYTSCPDVCPTTLIAVHDALEQLGPEAQRVASVFISVDPERDTAPRLAVYTAAFDPRIVALTGSAPAIARAAEKFHIRYAKQALRPGSSDYSMAHTAVLYVVDAAHRVIAAVPESGAPREIAAAIVSAIRADSR